MTFDRERWKNREKRNQGRSPTEREPREGIFRLVQAAPKMDRLTKSEDWNEYLTYLQAEIEKAENDEKIFIEQLLQPNLWDATEIVRIKAAVLAVRERINAWRLMLELPKQILEGAKRADKILGEA